MYSMHNIVSSKHTIGFYSCKTFFKQICCFCSHTVYKEDSVLKLKILLKSSEIWELTFRQVIYHLMLGGIGPHMQSIQFLVL